MKVATRPANEDQRLNDLYSYEILDTESEVAFDELVQLASQICKCPISLVTFIDKDRQWFKAKTGITVNSTPRDLSCCAHAILQDEIMVVGDAFMDERFHDNPLVTGGPKIRFYAGAPIISPAGHKMGTLCIIDTKPKVLTEEESKILTLLSNQVTRLLEIKQKNLLLRKRAEEIIQLKTKAINRVIEDTEKEKQAIAYDLREQFAQVIASSILYLNMAENDRAEQQTYIHTAKDQLTNALNDIRKLSYTVSPNVMNWMNPEQVVRDFIEQTAFSYPFTIEVTASGRHASANFKTPVVALRVIEQWLKILSAKHAASKVTIALTCDTDFKLQIEDNESNCSIVSRKRELIEVAIHEKIRAYNGNVSVQFSKSGNCVLKVTLPEEMENDGFVSAVA